MTKYSTKPKRSTGSEEVKNRVRNVLKTMGVKAPMTIKQVAEATNVAECTARKALDSMADVMEITGHQKHRRYILRNGQIADAKSDVVEAIPVPTPNCTVSDIACEGVLELVTDVLTAPHIPPTRKLAAIRAIVAQ